MTTDDWAEGYVDANGVRLHYSRTGGDDPPLVLAHGFYDDGPCRTPLVRALEDDYDVVAYDARGHGRSDAPAEGYAVEDRVDDLVGLLDALAVENPVLVGHSMGGNAVAATAARHSALPRAVVLIDPAGMLDVESDVQSRVETVRERIHWWQDHGKAALIEADDELRAHVEDGNRELASLIADARLRLSPNVVEISRHGYADPATIYPDVEAPALILKADADDSQRAANRATAELLPDGRLVHVDGAGHCVFRDERERATEELRAFLAGV